MMSSVHDHSSLLPLRRYISRFLRRHRHNRCDGRCRLARPSRYSTRHQLRGVTEAGIGLGIIDLPIQERGEAICAVIKMVRACTPYKGGARSSQVTETVCTASDYVSSHGPAQ